ncbi:MAG: hypothetical protein K2Y37_22610 [Pirellulales bacterium]|nr:hypothetical protein [Pirellulales bacterium]
MLILATTDVTEWIGMACLGACLGASIGLMLHAIVARRVRTPLTQVGWKAALVRAGVELVALWLWLSATLPLLAWGFWIGDNDHWFYHYAWLFAAFIAAGIGALSVWRYLRGAASKSYRAVHLWIPIGLIAAMAGVRFYDFAYRIEGWTAEDAAHNILARMPYDEPVRLVEMTAAEGRDVDPSRRRVYLIMGADEPRGRIVVGRYRRFWWTFGSNEGFPPSREALSRAKEFLEKTPWDKDGARWSLQTIVENYPNTPAAAEAGALLESLEQSPTKTP